MKIVRELRETEHLDFRVVDSELSGSDGRDVSGHFLMAARVLRVKLWRVFTLVSLGLELEFAGLDRVN